MDSGVHQLLLISAFRRLSSRSAERRAFSFSNLKRSRSRSMSWWSLSWTGKSICSKWMEHITLPESS